MAAPSLITHMGRHWLYYLGINERHDCDSPKKKKAIGVATLALDRFAYLSASSNASSYGWFETLGFQVEPSSRLLLNAVVPLGSSLQVEVAPLAEGDPPALSGYARADSNIHTVEAPIDEAALEARWATKSFAGVSGEVRLRFYLQGTAKLYSFQLAR